MNMMASSRPHRKCVRRLSDEAINGILSDLSDASDDPDDPDFEVESDSHHQRSFLRSTPKKARISDANSNSSASPPASAKTPADVPRPVLKPVPKPATTPTSIMTLDDLNIESHTSTTSGDRYICCVTGCSSGTLSNIDGLWLYPLPEDKELREAWNREIKPIDLEANRPRSPRICFRHFDSSSFVRRQQRLMGLKKGAVPSASASAAALAAANNLPKRGGYRGRSVLPTNSVVAQAAAAAEGSKPASPAPQLAGTEKVITPRVAPGTGTEKVITPRVIPGTGTEKVIIPRVTSGTGTQPTAVTKTYVKRPVRSPVVQGAVVPVAITPANPGLLKPQTELFIDLTAEEATVEEKKATDAADGTIGATNDTKVVPVAFSEAPSKPEQVLGLDYAAEDGYVLTLEDVEEELPWVVPDMHWNSELVDGELHLVWNNSPNKDCCKKVVLGKDMKVKVFVSKTQVVLGVRQVTNVASLKSLFMELSKL